MQKITILYEDNTYIAYVELKESRDKMLDYGIFLKGIVDSGMDLNEFLSEGFDVHDDAEYVDQSFVYEVDDDNKVWMCDYDFSSHWLCLSDYKIPAQ